jgi:preprotein translocase subunit SecG
MWLLMPILVTLLVIICLLMILTILMQRPKSEGLGAAFGGGLTDNLFGAQTTTVLTKFTVWLGGLFFALTLLISVLQVKVTAGPTAIQKQLMKAPSPASSPVVRGMAARSMLSVAAARNRWGPPIRAPMRAPIASTSHGSGANASNRMSDTRHAASRSASDAVDAPRQTRSGTTDTLSPSAAVASDPASTASALGAVSAYAYSPRYGLK